MLNAAPSLNQASDLHYQSKNPYYHPSTSNIEVLTEGKKAFFMHHKQMSDIASRYGLNEVVRWQPKDVSSILKIQAHSD